VRRLDLPGFSSFTHATLAVVLLMHVVTFAQDVTEPSLKAAFIYNLARYTEWPGASPASGPFVICVLGDPAVSDALGRVVKGRELASRSITVSLVTAGPMRRCHMLYLSGVSASQATLLLADLQDAPVLTISDIAGFTDAGGTVQFFFESGQLRFRIKLQALKRTHLQISSKVLLLAKRYE
jgi:hypothetical protein